MADMSPVKAPANLPALVKTAFERAKAKGDLTYYPTQVALLSPKTSVPFQLRFSPALAAKPKPSKPKDEKAKPFNPFENPLPSMTVSQLGPDHVLVLNKFAVVPEHFILATRAVKPQTHLLEKDDIAATYACIQAYHEAKQELFAFFNSGPHSGASQPHRHVQLLPVEQMRAGLESLPGGQDWGILAEQIRGQEHRVPFSVLTEAIAPAATTDELHSAYVRLYRHAARLLLPQETAPDQGESRISYNLALTRTTMALCPRVAEGALVTSQTAEDVGPVSLNGTVLAGTALVKNQAEWDALRETPDKLLHVLRQIGVPLAKASGHL
jgi:ATP adenylyltransferase